MQFITDENSLNYSGDTAFYFYASWMPHHSKMISMISKIEDKYKNLNFQNIDVDFFKGLCKKFKISSIPVIIFFKNNKEIKRVNGLVLSSAFKRTVADIYDNDRGI